MPQPSGPEQDSRFSALIRASFDVYYDWYLENDQIEYSSQIAELLRQTDNLPGSIQEWAQLLHPDDRRWAVAENQRVVREGGLYAGEYRIRRGDGSYVSVHDRGVMLKDADGKPSHMIGVLRDVSTETEAELARREAANLYATLFSQTINPAYHIAADGRFLDANSAGLDFLGIRRGRLLGETVASLWGDAAAGALRQVLDQRRAASSLEIDLLVHDSPRSLVVTLIPCFFRRARGCFALGTDLSGHEALRRDLEASEDALRRQAGALEDANTALRVILEERNRQSAELERVILSNVQSMVMPLLEKLGKRLAGSPESIYVDALRENLAELVLPFGQVLDELSGNEQLSPREREIINLIRAGKTSSEIAEALYISLNTVKFHRKRLRQKLGIGSDVSLASYLAASIEGRRASDGGA